MEKNDGLVRIERIVREPKILPDLRSQYVVIDLETTGLDPENCSIIEIAAVKVISEEVFETYNCLIRLDDGQVLSDFIVNLTGITSEILDKKGCALEESLPVFLQFIGDMPLVAHNVKFDRNFLWRACDKIGIARFENICFDTLSVSRKFYSNANHKLSELVKMLKLDVKQSHRALNDCWATKLLLNDMQKKSDWNKWVVEQHMGWVKPKKYR